MKLIATTTAKIDLNQLIKNFTDKEQELKATIDKSTPFYSLCDDYHERFDAISEQNKTDFYFLIAGENFGLIIKHRKLDSQTETTIWETNDTDDIENLLNELDPQ